MAVKKTGQVSRSRDIIISSLISIAITIVFGYYFFYLGERERKPTFYVDPVRTTILDKTHAANAPLRLLKANGDTVKADVTSVYFYFFNQGKETIKRQNVYSPLKISLGDSAKILDFKVLKVARHVSGTGLKFDSASCNQKNAQCYNKTKLIAIDPLYFVVALGIFLIAAYIYLVLSKRYPKNSLTLLFLFSAIPIFYLLLVFYKTEWFVTHWVPDSLSLQKPGDLFAISGWFK